MSKAQTIRKQELFYLWDLLVQMVGRDLKLRYRGSILGTAWSLLNPLTQLLVFNFVFSSVLPLNIPNYTLFLFIGLLAWVWFQTSLTGAATVIIDGRALIKQPNFPATILPVVVVVANLLHFLLALPILFFFLSLARIPFSEPIVLLPVIIALQMLFTVSLAYFVATFHVFFRDTQHLVGVFLFLFFYLTPVFYNADAIPDKYQLIYRMNPVLQLLEAYRAVLLHNTWPSPGPLLLLGGISGILLMFGYHVFKQASDRFVEEL
jgi:homopolymeric O-antigen transport system permease protein